MHLFTPKPAPAQRHPTRILIEETDPTLRLNAHLELGRRAMARRDPPTALTHFQEAHKLDPDDERPRAELRSMGANQKKRRFLRFWRR